MKKDTNLKLFVGFLRDCDDLLDADAQARERAALADRSEGAAFVLFLLCKGFLCKFSSQARREHAVCWCKHSFRGLSLRGRIVWGLRQFGREGELCSAKAASAAFLKTDEHKKDVRQPLLLQFDKLEQVLIKNLSNCCQMSIVFQFLAKSSQTVALNIAFSAF